jgi:amidohydrolase
MLSIAENCKVYEQKMIDWRRHLRMNPEPSFKEFKTVEFLKRELDAIGVPYEDVEGTLSFAGIIEGAKPGRKLALRADMDALPMQDEIDKPYRSKTDGVAHTCGHDAHMAMLLGAASVLQSRRADFAGTVYLLFQAAEEFGGGAPELTAHLKGKGGVDRIVALHIWASIPVGEMMLLPGAAMSGLFAFRFTLKGQGGHGSRPDLVKDPIKPSCDLALKLSAIPSNFVDVMDNTVVHICEVGGGTALNIFPETAKVGGGARFFKPASGEKIREVVLRMAQGVADAYGVGLETWQTPVLPPVVNDAAATEDARRVLAQMEGMALYADAGPLAASDNISVLLSAFPGVYGILGAGNAEKGIDFQQHSPRFDIDENALVLGCEFLARCAFDYLR